MRRIKQIYLLTSLLMVLSLTINAQKKRNLQQPKVILVQLKAEANRIDYYQKKKNYSKADLVQKQADTIAQMMIRDFEENFRYRPVYYFYDTNAHLVKDKKFAGILLDKNREPLKNISITASDSDQYYIATFGYSLPMKSQPNSSKMGKGLVIVDHSYKAMEPPFPHYIFRLARMKGLFDKKMPEGWYESKQFDMEYFPVAKAFSESLASFFH